MILLIDNYDSFTFNLCPLPGRVGAEVEVRRNDALSVADALAMQPQAIVLSPGPCDPDRAGICLDLVRQPPARCRCSGSVSAIRRSARRSAARSSARRSRCTARSSAIHHDATDIFAGLPNPLQGDALPSLIVESREPARSLASTAGPRTAWSWASPIASRRCTACSSIPKASPRPHGHSLLRTSSTSRRRPLSPHDANSISNLS